MKKKESTKGGVKRLQKRESKLASKGAVAVDEGRERKADRLLGRAAKVENKIINKAKRK
jgi:phage shock protein A